MGWKLSTCVTPQTLVSVLSELSKLGLEDNLAGTGAFKIY